MTENSFKQMDSEEKPHRSISRKALYGIFINFIVFSVVAELVAITFYAFSSTRELLENADSLCRYTIKSTANGKDIIGFADACMERYYSLSETDRQKLGTKEYRSFFSDLDMSEGSNYYRVKNILHGAMGSYDIDDIYIAMYDRDNSRVVCMVDGDDTEEKAVFPGYWEPVNKPGMEKFLAASGKSLTFDSDWTEKYGLLCTVGVPIKDDRGNTCAFIFVDLSVTEVVSGIIDFALRLLVASLIVTIILAVFMTRQIDIMLVEPLNRILKASKDYVKDRQDNKADEIHFANLGIHTGDELENLSVIMAQMERELFDYEANQSKIVAEKERIGTELSLAFRIQAAMLPHEFPPFPDRNEFDVYGTMEPAREVGGDFYDFFLIDDDHLCFLIADVSGKGIPAALFMMISQTILKSCAMLGRSAAEILSKTNEALCSNNQAEMFVTVWLGILEISTGILTAANAGHEYPAIKRADGSFELLKDKHGFIIGGMEDVKYTEYTMQLNHGDKIFVYTDGIAEATDKDNQMYGVDRMIQALNSDPDANTESLIRNVRTSVADFVGDAEQFDDMTMLSFEYK